jgi:hypothetical protein
MKTVIAALALLMTAAGITASTAAAGGWQGSVLFTNQVASSPASGGGYPVPAGSTAPDAGTCRAGLYNSNRSESWVAVQPGTENLVGGSKFFFEKFSTFYDFHLGAYSIPGGSPGANTQIPGYDCVSTGTQEMPPSWTNNTDPNMDFDNGGRAYEVTLPFNAFWVNLHPNGAIGVVYSDDLGKTWKPGNGGQFLATVPNSSSFSFGDVVDKQWVAVNRTSLNPKVRDSVYAMWALFNGFTVEVKASVSRDRGQTFSKPVTVTPPSGVGPSNTYIIPSVDASGDLFASFASFPACCSSPGTIYVERIADDGTTLTPGPFTQVGQTATTNALPNTRFRDGITETFAASQTYAGHLYVAWEAWDGTQMDVVMRQSTDYGVTWSAPTVVNDNVDGATATDQFQPTVAAGGNGAVAVGFYDRRAACPTGDSAILAADQGRENFCIATSLQVYKDNGAGAVPVGPNYDISTSIWDPEQPGQKVDGLSQYPCAGHRDPCPSGRGFIGDYFGLAVSAGNVYALSVSTHFPSKIKADGGGRVYYQQQVLATVSRGDLGI